MYKITEEQKKVIEKGLLTAIDNGTDDEFTSQEMHLINDAFELVNNLTIPVVVGTLFCEDCQKWVKKECTCGNKELSRDETY